MKHPEYDEFGFKWADEIYPMDNEEEEENMMSDCERRGCGYFWREENELYPSCHYNDPLFPAPCEQDDDEHYEYEDWGDDFDEDECESMDDLEMGFDPYEGGYTWDC